MGITKAKERIYNGRYIRIHSDLIQDAGAHIKITYRLYQGKEPENNSVLYEYAGSFSMARFISIFPGATANCQVSSVRNGQLLAKLTDNEFREFIRVISTGDPGIIYRTMRSTLLLDVYAKLRTKLDKKFKSINAIKRLSRKYTNRTGSEMAVLLYDIRG